MTKRIFWDKGHGGQDSGAVGNGLEEKQLTHEIVEYAMDFLSSNYTGFIQKTSRTGDTYPSLTERARMANDWNADVFVSVHINAGGGSGYESYVHTTKASKASISLQNYLNNAILSAMRNFGNIKAHGGDMVREANYSVLRNTNAPAVLTENLYIDSSDSMYLKNEQFLKAVGQAHAIGVAKFLNLPSKSVPQKTPTSVQLPAKSEAIGTVKVLVDDLWYYNKPDWNAKVGKVKKGDVFTVVNKIKVNTAYMYHLISGTYITAATKYVKFTKK
ncbi:N-acetylmuramoyl-L-alanine amidase [Priestia sp. FSL W8-0524]|uniref:N-acetylmuramoyl-L-alanine amidase n=1 Tax=Priestia sp. FSL W8-0524 TaxID=2954625 RepID=UPI0030F9B474